MNKILVTSRTILVLFSKLSRPIKQRGVYVYRRSFAYEALQIARGRATVLHLIMVWFYPAVALLPLSLLPTKRIDISNNVEMLLAMLWYAFSSDFDEDANP